MGRTTRSERSRLRRTREAALSAADDLLRAIGSDGKDPVAILAVWVPARPLLREYVTDVPPAGGPELEALA